MLVSCLDYSSTLKMEAFLRNVGLFSMFFACYLSHAGILLVLFLDREDGVDIPRKRRISSFSACCLFHVRFLLGLFFDAENGGVPPKRRFIFIVLCLAYSSTLKMEAFFRDIGLFS
jgi:hypothetical protein